MYPPIVKTKTPEYIITLPSRKPTEFPPRNNTNTAAAAYNQAFPETFDFSRRNNVRITDTISPKISVK